MASPNLQTNGIGGTTGGEVVTLAPTYTSGDIWYVHSATGSDAASPRGKDRQRPLATLAQAITNSAANDTIVMLSGHAETVATSQIPLAGQIVVGEGSGSNRPTMTFTPAAPGSTLFLLNGAGVWLDNMIFNVTAQASTEVQVSAAGARVTNCQFNCESTTTAGIYVGSVSGTNLTVKDCTFTSLGSSFSTQGANGVLVAAAINDVLLDTVVFDGGTYGWSDYACEASAAITRLRGINVDLLNDSDAILATGSTGMVHVRNKSGSARVVWTA